MKKIVTTALNRLNILGILLPLLLINQCTNSEGEFPKNQQYEEEILYLKDNVYKNPTHVIERCDSILNNSSNLASLAKIYYYKGQAEAAINDLLNSLETFDIALKQFQKDSNVVFQLKTLNAISHGQTSMGNYLKASEAVNKSLALAKKKKMKNMEASAYSALSYIHYSNDDFGPAISYLLKAKNIYLESKDSLALSSIYNNIAVLYKKVEDFDNAIEYNNRSLKLNLAFNLNGGVSSSYNNIGSIYLLKGNIQEAKSYFLKSIQINEEFQIRNSNPYRNIAEVEFIQRNHTKSKEYLMRAISIDEINENLTKTVLNYEGLIKNHSAQKEYSIAFGYQSKLDSIKQLILNKRAEESINMLENQNVLNQNRHKLEIANSEAKTAKVILISVFILLVLIVILSIQGIRSVRNKNRTNTLIMEQKVLRSQMNPHFIFNILSAIQNSIMDKNPLKSVSYIAKLSKLVRHNFELANKTSITLREEMDTLKAYIDTQQIRFSDKLNFFIEIDPEINQDEFEVPPMLLQPFVENSIQHAFNERTEDCKITFSARQDKNSVVLSIIDNGIGSVPKEDGKIHAIDIVRKRLSLLKPGLEKELKIENLGKGIGTKVSFKLKV